MDDPRRAEWETHVAADLAKRRCPYGGGLLSIMGEVRIPEGTLSCRVCDCFGFDPADARLGVGRG